MYLFFFSIQHRLALVSYVVAGRTTCGVRQGFCRPYDSQQWTAGWLVPGVRFTASDRFVAGRTIHSIRQGRWCRAYESVFGSDCPSGRTWVYSIWIDEAYMGMSVSRAPTSLLRGLSRVPRWGSLWVQPLGPHKGSFLGVQNWGSL